MQVGVGNEGHHQPGPSGSRAQSTQVAARVDSQGSPVTQVDQIRGVAQTLVHQGHHRRKTHRHLTRSLRRHQELISSIV